MAVSPKSRKITLEDLPRYLSLVVDDRRDRALRSWKREGRELAKELIDKSIGKGISPVRRGGDSTGGRARYKAYSESYEDKIRRYISGKRVRPVNLKVSGKMRRSIKSRETREGFYVWYQDKKADYHNKEGAGKSRIVRQMLPYANQRFSRTITSKLQNLYVELFNKLR